MRGGRASRQGTSSAAGIRRGTTRARRARRELRRASGVQRWSVEAVDRGEAFDGKPGGRLIDRPPWSSKDDEAGNGQVRRQAEQVACRGLLRTEGGREN